MTHTNSSGMFVKGEISIENVRKMLLNLIKTFKCSEHFEGFATRVYSNPVECVRLFEKFQIFVSFVYKLRVAVARQSFEKRYKGEKNSREKKNLRK